MIVVILHLLRGQGGVFINNSHIDLLVVSDRGDQYLSDAFGPIKNIVPSQSYNRLDVSAKVLLYFARDFHLQFACPENRP